MTGGSYAIGRLRDVEVLNEGADCATDTVDSGATDRPRRDLGPLIYALLAWLCVLAWLVVECIANANVLSAGISPGIAAQLIREASPPLILIVALYMIAVRGVRSQGGRYRRLSLALRSEQDRLDSALVRTAELIEVEKEHIAEQTDRLMSVGEDAAHRLHALAERLTGDLDKSVRDGASLQSNVQTARGDISALLIDLPRARAQTLDLTTAIDAAGMSAHEHAGALDAQVAQLAARGRDADETVGGAAQKLAAHLSRVEGASSAACLQLTEAAATMTSAIDAALGRAAEAGDAARSAMDAQGAAMHALVDRAEVSIEKTGAESLDALNRRVAEVSDRLQALGALLDDHALTSHSAIERIGKDIDAVDARIATIDSEATPRNKRIAEGLAALATNTQQLTAALGVGTTSAETLIARTETLVTALDAASREVGETLPDALGCLDDKTEATRAKIADLSPEIAQIERQAASALDRLLEAEAALAKQRASLDALASGAADRLSVGTSAAAALITGVEDADRRVREVAETAGTTLVEALVRVRETAQVAAERAREAIGAIVPGSAESMAMQLKNAFAAAVEETITTQIAQLGSTADLAVDAASGAADRLMRQMLTIAETSAQVEAQIAQVQTEMEDADRDGFARRVALLIESLNSTAIDVTKIFSNDVTDGAWGAYLKGDRGVFTRRAVRLLDTGEAREIVRHYNDDVEFRGQVNRYVHDFEAMLRNVLATRAGSPLGITLLSSDMGKLYVALAQAIERLRA